MDREKLRKGVREEERWRDKPIDTWRENVREEGREKEGRREGRG